MQVVSTTAPPRGSILIVEDDPQIAAAIQGALEDEGYDARVAGNVAEASAMFTERAPSMILLDWNLPDGSGEDVVRAVRPRNSSVPIVVMSAARDAIVASYAVDARDRLAKPFDLDRLVALVRRYCG
jgi:two-component system, OmpR family, phosphate regulon response regulator PhoB